MRSHGSGRPGARTRRAAALALSAVLAVVATPGCSRPSPPPGGQVFDTPQAAVEALATAVKGGRLDDVVAVFGSESRDLVAGSDPATGRRHQQVFLAAFAEGWRLVDRGPAAKELVIGNEEWPFPVPVVPVAGGWAFDVAAGRDEILSRRIGRNELAVIDLCRMYVRAQRAYAARGHDGRPAGLFARRFASDAGTENGLYWPAAKGAPRSPLGDLVAQAASDGARRDATGLVPLHGYYFRILEQQGPAAAGGARSYVVDGALSGGFGLVAWPARYDDSGVVTFVVNGEGIVHEKDLGPDTARVVEGITSYDPDPTWTASVTDPADR